MTGSQKRAWAKPVVTSFANVDDLREHLQSKATVEGVAAIEAMADRLRKQGCSPPEPDEEPGKLAVGRRA